LAERIGVQLDGLAVRPAFTKPVRSQEHIVLLLRRSVRFSEKAGGAVLF